MVRILVVSDLHAYTPRDSIKRPPSFLVNSGAPTAKVVNPLKEIPAVLDREDLGVDWIFCPGDIADQADPDAQTFAWEGLVELKSTVKAKLLMCTAGNHDLDSRLKFSNYDPKGHLQNLSPPFPGMSENVADRYWSRNFCIHEENGIRVVNLNSAAFHGFHSGEATQKPEYLHGRVSNRTIDAIVKEVSKKTCEHNILLTHHHPYKNEEIYDQDYSEMELGGKLINKLSEATNSSWLIIHGHQHYPLLKYGAATVFPPVIFSAGSMSAALSSPLSAEAPNQFYHITLETDSARTKGWWPCGLVRAWHWAFRRSWQQSSMEHNIPYGVGFGCRENIQSIIAEIIELMKLQPSKVFEMSEVFKALPHLQFVIGPTFAAIGKALGESGVRCTNASPIADSTLRWIV
jgi:predicted phosphodiesterase